MKWMIASALLLSGISFVQANETYAEKAEAKVKEVKRDAKKKVHRIEEKFCQEGDAECLAKKAKHRTQESGEAIKDTADEAINKIDHE